MILQNSKGQKKEFTVLMQIVKEEDEYIIYQDEYNKQVYAGKKKKNRLKKLNPQELTLIDELLTKIGE